MLSVSDLELDDDGDDYDYDGALGIVNNTEQGHSRSPNTPTPTPSDLSNYDEFGASRSKRQKLQDDHIDFDAMGAADEDQDLHNLISHLHDDFNDTIKKPSIVDNH